MTIHVYVGPTLRAAEITEVVPGARVHPPVAHGDLLSLAAAPGDLVVIIDGYYHQRAPVRHKEVLHLVDRGVRVVGCASMGALRAAELDACGMIGHGRVYDMYRRGEIDADDEVAVAHVAGDSFEVRNVPLVTVRHAVDEAVRAGALTVAQADSVVAAARSVHYTERSWGGVRTLLEEGGEHHAMPALQAFLEAHPECADVKRRDALETLADLPQVLASASAVVPLGHWQNRHVYEWLPEFQGSRDDDGDLISAAETVRYLQVHLDDFPARWQAFVLGEVCRGPDVRADPEDPVAVARAVFGRAGVVDAVQSVAGNGFLTAAEHTRLAPDDVLVRTLVRSYVPPRGLHDVWERLALPADLEEVHRVIEEARAINDQVLWNGRIRLVERLSAKRLTRHLGSLWGVPHGVQQELLARARDRGLPSLSDAVAAVRPYFLRVEARTGSSIAVTWSAQ